MRIRRGLLFWGCFLIPLGAIPLLVRAGVLDPAAIAGAWRLWPLILVAIGLAIVLGRSRAAALGTVAVAAFLGVIVGATLASGSSWFGALGDCVGDDDGSTHLSRNGAFDGPADVTIDIRCGSARLSTGDVAGWTLEADHRGSPPVVDAGGDRLAVRAPEGTGQQRQDWTIQVAPTSIREIEVTGNAATTSFVLAGADVDRLSADLNAGTLFLDATGARIAALDVTTNAGRVAIRLGEGALTGSISANAGAIDVCVPDSAELRIQASDQITFSQNLAERGLARDGTTWTRAGTSGLIELDVEGNAVAFNLNPSGGCNE
jgi:hypothetical protein